MIPFANMARCLVGLLALASLAVSGERPFPPLENGKVSLLAAESPYVLEQGVVFSPSDTFSVEPGVTVLMGEYAKIMFRGTVKIHGTAEHPVVFRSLDSNTSWNGIHFTSMNRDFDIKNLVVENAFRNSVFRSKGSFENVRFENNYYGLWLDDAPEVRLSHCEFSKNRYALSVRAGQVSIYDSRISDNVYGLFLESGGTFVGDKKQVASNSEADIRSEADELAKQGKRVNRAIWRHLETAF
ncbi:MAG: right-handed parallel beta-helix repeat-containing protein [Fibrobacter sp.]|nr:right-handed parallel beta-helix repeat-containing protein [Fibrobacter sp.]